MNDLKVALWPIDKVIPYARNARKIPQRAIDKVARIDPRSSAGGKPSSSIKTASSFADILGCWQRGSLGSPKCPCTLY